MLIPGVRGVSEEGDRRKGMVTVSTSTASFKRFGGSAPENYERYFVPPIGRPFAVDLVSAAQLRKGERVLDIACGTGIVARLAAEQVLPGGAVAGVDVNPGMLAVAKTTAPPEASIEWHEGTAEAIPVRDQSFDVALCSLGLQFIPDKGAALGELHRVLSSGGRIAFNAVGPAPEPFEAFAEALGRHIKPEAAGFVRQVFSLHDPAEVRDLVDDAGFRDVSIRSKTMTLRLPPPQEFLWQYLKSTPLVQMVEGLDEAGRSALEEDVSTEWKSFADGDVTVVESIFTVATARRR